MEKFNAKSRRRKGLVGDFGLVGDGGIKKSFLPQRGQRRRGFHAKTQGAAHPQRRDEE